MVAARSAVEEIRLGMTELRAEPWKLLAKSTNADETAYVIRQATRDYAEAARNLEGLRVVSAMPASLLRPLRRN